MTADELADEVASKIKEQAKYIAQLECELQNLKEEYFELENCYKIVMIGLKERARSE
jgi:peptidoglycan hydrolase CwlO-like protein